MLHAALLRSPYAHARIRSIDVSAARAVPGVHAVLTGADLDWCDPYFGPAFRDRPILAIDVVRYEGEPVAAAVAEDEAAAREALERIDVDYEPLTAVTTIEEALASGAPLVHTGEPLAGHFADLSTLRPVAGSNVCHQFHLERGRGAAAFAEADLVLEDTLQLPARAALFHGAPLRARRAGTRRAASPSGPPRRIRTPCGSSSPRCSACRSHRIRIVVPLLGGGFGGKTYAKIEPIASALARVARRPVRPGDLRGGRLPHRPPLRCARARRLGLKRDGQLWAAECSADFDVGAYADIGPRIIQKGTYTATGPYRVAHVTLSSRAVYTNTTPGGAFRGFGVPQLAWAFESLLDEAARRLGSGSGRAAPAEPSRPRRGIRARRDAHRRQVRGEPERAPPRRSAGARRPRPIGDAGSR